MEIWKAIPGYENHYMVSDLGRIKSFKRSPEIIMKYSIDKYGYKGLNLNLYGVKKQFKIHQLVVMAFLNHRPCGMEKVVDHIDDDRTNNNLSNLQILTNLQNIRKGMIKIPMGAHLCKQTGKWKSEITHDGIRYYLGRFPSQKEAHNAYQAKLKKFYNEKQQFI